MVAYRISTCLTQKHPPTTFPKTKWNPVTITSCRDCRDSLPAHVQVILLTLSPRDSMAFHDSETKPSRDLRTCEAVCNSHSTYKIVLILRGIRRLLAHPGVRTRINSLSLYQHAPGLHGFLNPYLR